MKYLKLYNRSGQLVNEINAEGFRAEYLRTFNQLLDPLDAYVQLEDFSSSVEQALAESGGERVDAPLVDGECIDIWGSSEYNGVYVADADFDLSSSDFE